MKRLTTLTAAAFIGLAAMGSPSHAQTIYTSKAAFDAATNTQQLDIPNWNYAPWGGALCANLPLLGTGPDVDFAFGTNNLNVTFVAPADALCIFDNTTTAPNPANTTPDNSGGEWGGKNLLVANGEDDYLLTFTTPVTAFALQMLTNVNNTATITLKDGGGAVIGSKTVGGAGDFSVAANQISEPTTFYANDFIGFTSGVPIKTIEIDTTGGAQQNSGFLAFWAGNSFKKEITSGPCVSDLSETCEALPGPFVAGADLHTAETTEIGEPSVPVNDAWSYGTSNTANAGASFVAFPGTWHSDTAISTCIGGLQGWAETPDAGNDFVPTLAVNASGVNQGGIGPCAVIDGQIEPQKLFVHPGPTGSPTEFVVLRWTAPAAGTIDITADWIRKHSNATCGVVGDGVSAHVRKNGAVLGADGTTTAGPVNYVQNGVAVAAGDTIDFVTGSIATYFCDSTQLDATVTYPAAGDIAVAIEAPQPESLHYDFKITVDTSGLDDPMVHDTVPAEWDVALVDGIEPGNGSNTNRGEAAPGLACGQTDDSTIPDVTVMRGGNEGKECQSDTDLWWTPADDAVSMLRVDLQSRLKNSAKQFFSPTGCGALYLNKGAVLKDGEAIVGETNALVVAAVKDLDGGGVDPTGAGDEDADNVTDIEEVRVLGTDPCNPDTDGDGVQDDVDQCPLEGPPGAGYILAPNGCVIPDVM